MARYRKIDVRIWSDAKFRALTPGQPSGQGLFLYLLTTPQTSLIPGAISMGESAMAEALGWQVKGFREAFREVSRQGLAKADWDARFVWLPNAIKYNPPQSPNVVMSWRTHWDELPECALKTQAWEQLNAYLKGMSKGFQEAFAKACPKPKANQEQDQDQEYIDLAYARSHSSCEQPEPAAAELSAVSVRKSDDRADEVREVFAHYRVHHPRACPKPKPTSKEWKAIRARLDDGYSVERLKLAIDGCHLTPHNLGENDRNTAYLSLYLIVRDGSQVDRFAETAERAQAGMPIAPRQKQRTLTHNEQVMQNIYERYGYGKQQDDQQGLVYEMPQLEEASEAAGE